MIFDVITVIVLRCHKPHLYKTVNLLGKCVLWLLNQHVIPLSLFLYLSPPLPFLDTQHIEIRTSNNPTVASKCLSERKSLMSLIWNKKLEMIKLSEEGKLKAETALKLGFVYQSAKRWMQRKSSWRKLKMLLQWIHKWYKKVKRPYWWYKVCVVWIQDQSSHNTAISQSLIQSRALSL